MKSAKSLLESYFEPEVIEQVTNCVESQFAVIGDITEDIEELADLIEKEKSTVYVCERRASGTEGKITQDGIKTWAIKNDVKDSDKLYQYLYNKIVSFNDEYPSASWIEYVTVTTQNKTLTFADNTRLIMKQIDLVDLMLDEYGIDVEGLKKII